MNQPAPKYRPSLTQQQIAYIIALCDAELRPEIAPMAAVLSNQLKVFAFKMQLGLVGAAFISSNGAGVKESIEERLEFTNVTPVQRREMAYRKWSGSPQLCTADEIRMANTFRYESNMMSIEEEAAYESSIST